VTSLAERRRLRLFTLCALFFAQGIPWGFMAITLPAYVSDRLSARHLDDAAITGVVADLVAYTTLPFAFKFVWGPLMDSFTIPRLGRRRPWIVLAQAMMAASVAALLVIDDVATQIDLLLVLVLVHTVFNAMQNVAVDALAIDLLDASERGRANGLMYGSKYVGGAVGGAGLGFVLAHGGLHTAIAIQAVVLVAIGLVPLLVRESSGPPPPKPDLGVLARTLARLAKLRSVQLTSALMFVQYIAVGMVSGVGFVLFIKQLGWSDDAYSEFAGGPSLLCGAAGAALGGWLADRVGHRKLAAMASASLAVLWLLFALGKPYWTDIAPGVLVLEPLTQGAMTAAMLTICMDASLPRTAATQYVAYTSLLNLGTTFGAKLLSRRALEAFGYQGIYLAAGAVQLAGIVLLRFIDPDQARRELV
jgi:PAT family beta-lactamase induction signal transducer AmpG